MYKACPVLKDIIRRRSSNEIILSHQSAFFCRKLVEEFRVKFVKAVEEIHLGVVAFVLEA